MEGKLPHHEGMCCHRCGPLARQVCSVLVVSSTMLQVGLILGWPAVLPSMQAEETPSFNVTDNDVKWLVSCVGIAGMFSNLPAGLLIDYFGYRHLLTLLLLPVSATWFLQAFTSSLALLYLGRVLGGIGLMIFTTLVPPLMAELLEPTYRGLLCCASEVVVSLGILLAYLMADFLHWRTFTLLCALPFIPSFFFSLAVPESPYWLVRTGRIKEAEAALVTLRGPAHKFSAQEELLEIQKSIEDQPQTSFLEQVKQLKHQQNLRPLLLMISLMILREFGGPFAIFSYAVYFFLYAGVVVDPSTCTILMGVARLIATCICACLLDRVGRRLILTVGCSCCAIATAVGSIFLLWDLPGSSWVPLLSVLVFAMGYGLGIGPIPWILLGELLPTPVRIVGAAIVTFIFAAMQVLVGLLFPWLVDEAGLGGSLLFFAVFNTILTAVVRLFLPETASRSLHHLEHAFSKVQSSIPLQPIASNLNTHSAETEMKSQQPLLA